MFKAVLYQGFYYTAVVYIRLLKILVLTKLLQDGCYNNVV